MTDALDAVDGFPFLTDDQRVALLRDGDLPTVHAVLREAEWGAAGRALTLVPPDRVADLLKDLHPDQAAGLLSRMAPARREAAAALLPMPLQGSVRELLDYPEGSVARRMNPFMLTLPEELTADRAFEMAREAARMMPVFYAYAVDRRGVLSGTVSLRKILAAEPKVLVRDLMERRVLAAKALDPAESAADLMSRHRFVAVPVVDASGRPLGMVTNADLADLLTAEADREVYSAAGVRPAEEQKVSFRQALRGRFPWFGITLSAGLACAMLAHAWEPRLADAARVLLFAPLILALGESIGTQTGLVVLHAGAAGAAARVVRREMSLGLLIGLGCAAVVAIVAWMVLGRADFAMLMAVAIPLVGAAGALVGVLMPGFLRRMGRDPAEATGPMILAAVDLCAITIYLGLAVLLLR